MELKLVAVMPIKLNNERLPGKNVRLLGEKPLLRYALDTLRETGKVQDINVYCSDRAIQSFLPDDVTLLERPRFLDENTSNFHQIFSEFQKVKPADVYVYFHATAPFLTAETMRECIDAVVQRGYDSAFTATRLQDFLWKDGTPLNFDAEQLPRSQDLPILYRETSGLYVFRSEVFAKLHRRIGEHPYIKQVSMKEAIDINTVEDFGMAERLFDWETT